MISLIEFKDPVYNYLKQTGLAKTIRSKVFRLSNGNDQLEYQNILNNFKKQVYYIKPYSMGKTKLNLVYFDIDRMIREYSLHCGIKSGEEALSNLDLKQRSNVMVKSIELLIEESIKDINTNIENTIDPSYSDLILQIETTWNKSFVINCIPNIEFGNYVNIPVEMVLEDNNDEIASFIDDEDYFFSLLNRIPLTVNKIRISELMFYNIVNSTIVPLFLDLNKKYVLIKD